MKAILDGKELTLGDKTEVTADQAVQAFEDALNLLARRVPGFAASGLAYMSARVTYELIHWMYAPKEHPTPAELMKDALELEEAMLNQATEAKAAGGKPPIIQ